MQEQVHDVAQRMSDARCQDSGVPCPGCGCTGAPFPDAVVILHVPPSTWAELVAARASMARTLVKSGLVTCHFGPFRYKTLAQCVMFFLPPFFCCCSSFIYGVSIATTSRWRSKRGATHKFCCGAHTPASGHSLAADLKEQSYAAWGARRPGLRPHIALRWP